MNEIWTVFAIIAAVPVIIVCIGCTLALWATGILTINQSLAGFGDPATIFVASLFVLSAELEVTGVTAWAGQLLISRAGASRTRLIVFMMLLVGILSALISVNGAVAALLPVVVVMAGRLGRSPSQLLMPLVFGAHCGSMLLLTGTPVNVLISEALIDAGGAGFGYFEFGLVGVPLVIGGVIIAVLFGERLLPSRESANLPADLSQHARTLVEEYRLSSGVYALRVREDSPLRGMERKGLDLSNRPGLNLVEVRTADGAASVRAAIEPGDAIVVHGDPEAVGMLATDLSLGLREELITRDRVESTLFNRESGLAEAVIPRRSPLIGQRFFPGMVTESGDLIVLAIQRQGADIAHDATLAAATPSVAGHLERARFASGQGRGARGRLARPRAPPGRADGARRADHDRGHGRWSCYSPPGSCRPRWRGCSRPAPSCFSASFRSSRCTGRSTGPW